MLMDKIKAFFGAEPDGRSTYTQDFFSGNDLKTVLSGAGIAVTEEEALKVMAVFACVSLIGNTMASLPLITYRRMKPRGRERAEDQELFELLRYQPNPETTAFSWRKAMQVNLELWGNAYAQIERSNAGRIKGLWFIPAANVEKKRDPTSKRIYYQIRVEGGYEFLWDSDVLHLMGTSPNGLTGYRPVDLARDALGLALACEKHGNNIFSNGANVSGVVTLPGKLSEDAFKRFKESFKEAYSGLSNSAKILFLESEGKYNQIQMPNDAAQYNETRKLQMEEVARFFGVPPHKIGLLEHATFSNIEHQALEFVQDCLLPRCTNWEQEIRRKLMSSSDKRVYFTEFLMDGLLRGDVKSRTVYYQIMRQNGVMSANDIREKENLNPIPEDQGGDLYLVNGNMIPANAAGTQNQPNQAGGEDDEGQKQA